MTALDLTRPTTTRAARSAAGARVIATPRRRKAWFVTCSAILLTGAMAVGACVPYPNQAPLSGSVQYGSVRDVQGGLQQLGYYDGALDGINGTETQQAILRYQSDRGLRRDGIIDDTLISRINADVNADTYPYPDASGPSAQTIGEVQQSLNDLGYFNGRADGQLDRDTQTAILSYRRDRGLPVTDTIDRQLMDTLRRDIAAAPPPVSDPVGSRFESGRSLPAGARAMLDRRWRNYEGMLVDLDRDGDLDVIARGGQFSEGCQNGNCQHVVLENRRGVYEEIGAFAASETRVLSRSTNGFSDIGYRMTGTTQGTVLRFDGRRYRL